MGKLIDFFVPYKSVLLGITALAIPVLIAFGVYKIHHAGYQSCEKDHAMASLAAYQSAVDAQEAARDKEQRSTQFAADVQAGATTAIQGVYDYYEKHPNVVYRNANSDRLPGASHPSTGGGAVSEAAACPSNRQADPADDGHPAAGDTQEVLIEPNLPARCADTTIQALECRRYVEGLADLLNAGKP